MRCSAYVPSEGTALTEGVPLRVEVYTDWVGAASSAFDWRATTIKPPLRALYTYFF
jgi:hypothetical protein